MLFTTMPELRTDWLTGRTVLVAENRAHRPNDFENGSSIANLSPTGEVAAFAGTQTVISPDCPFCPGNESRTPPAVYESTDGAGRWQLRVVPNKYPAVTSEPLQSIAPAHADVAIGAHEVIIESARHVDRMSALSEKEIRDVLTAYVERLRHWSADGRFRYSLIFKNQGRRAGASLAHVHSQLMALPEVPPSVGRELERVERDFVEHGSCPYCRLIEQERADRLRLVFDQDGFIAFCPFASLQPLEVWLLPTAHQPWFERGCGAIDSQRLAAALRALVGKLETQIPGVAYNMLLRTAPWQSTPHPAWHWRIELLPRVTDLAGLELATGVHINPMPPERAASRLRDA